MSFRYVWLYTINLVGEGHLRAFWNGKHLYIYFLNSGEGKKKILEKDMANHSSILAWRIPWTEESGRPQSIGLQRVGDDWSDLAHMQHFKVLDICWAFVEATEKISYCQVWAFLCLVKTGSPERNLGLLVLIWPSGAIQNVATAFIYSF